MQCNMPWQAICNAPGFTRGFQQWILSNLGWFVPTYVPEMQHVESLYHVFHEWVMLQVKKEKSEMWLENFARGVGMAFRAVKDRAAPPPTFIAADAKQQLERQRWTIQGSTRLLYQTPCVLEVGRPLCFHGLNAMLSSVGVDDEFLNLDRKVTFKHDMDLVVVQTRFEADPQKMQEMVCNAWNGFWQAPDQVPLSGLWH